MGRKKIFLITKNKHGSFRILSNSVIYILALIIPICVDVKQAVVILYGGHVLNVCNCQSSATGWYINDM